MTYEEIVRFHGHDCPGLAMGFRMARAAMAELNNLRAKDEELVAIVENDACGVDALQCLSGCTFGKGNLLFRDYGKPVYTLYSRTSGQGVRVAFHGRGAADGAQDDREAYRQWLLNAPEADLLTVERAELAEPEAARIRQSVACSVCGEPVMESRCRWLSERPVCIPCAEHRQAFVAQDYATD